MGDTTADLIEMLAIVALPALVIGYLVVLLLRRLIGHRWFRRFLFLLCLVAAGLGGALSYALVVDPSPATMLLPMTLAATGAGLGGLFAAMFKR
ncbi:MAG: hypothetical protein AAFR55_07465 [Pseudomonadota bacterium]